MKQSAVVDGKKLTLLAESTSSAGVAGSTAGTCSMKKQTYGDVSYYTMNGQFLTTKKQNEQTDAAYTNGETKYYLTDSSYNVRNDYTVTLASGLELGTATAGKDDSAAIIVKNKGTLDFGQTAQAGVGYGSLTFDGNYSYPMNGPMLEVGENSEATLHGGVTFTNHTNHSETMPGTVYSKGTFTMLQNSVISNGVSPKAGAVYIANGTFNLQGGDMKDNTGAMPRYGSAAKNGVEATGTADDLYHGQPKYYYGAGAVDADTGGKFNMSGGTISGNRGEWGAIANMGSGLTLTGGTISGNAAIIGTGEDTRYDLAINGYTEGDSWKTDNSENPGCGGGLYLGGSGTAAAVDLKGVTVTGNWAQNNGGGVAACGAAVNLTDNTVVTDNEARHMGGGIYTDSDATVDKSVTLTGNNAETGGGLAAMGTAGATADNKTVTISSNVQNNTAKYGSGIYVGAYAKVTLQGTANQTTLLGDNTAVYGGGAYIDCAKTVDSTDVTEPVNPGNAALGTDVTKSDGELVIQYARINNNHLTRDANDQTVGFGGGVYNRGTLKLDEGAYSSANDRLYLEIGHVVTLTDKYQASGQTTEDKLTINSRQTALGTNVIQMANAEQSDYLLKKGSEKTAHYAGIPMAVSSDANEKNIIELNYYTITYYDRLPEEGGLASHHVTDMVVPGNSYTILGWNAVNELTTEENNKLILPDGQSLGSWKIVKEENGNLVADEGEVKAGETYAESKNLILVANFTTNNYLAVMRSELAGTETPSTIGSVALYSEKLTTSADGEQSYFSKGTKMDMQIKPVSDDNGHQKGILTSLTVYKADRSIVNSESAPGERVYGQHIYSPVAKATFKSIQLKNGESYSKTGIPTGWEEIEGKELTGELGVTDNVPYYVGGTDNILVEAKFAQPAVELKMTGMKDGEVTTLTEYYDTMRQAFTRMANVTAGQDSAYTGVTWGTSTITPLKADDGKVYYFGKDYTGSTADKTVANNVNVVFDLNGFTLDLQNMPQQQISTYSLTLKNGTVESEQADESPFKVDTGGSLKLDNATLTAANSNYGIIVNGTGKLEVDQDSHAGNVLLNGDKTCITATDPTGWAEMADGQTETATIYTDLGTLVTAAADGKPSTTRTDRNVIDITPDLKASTTGHAVRSHFNLVDSVTTDTAGNETGNWFIGTNGYLYPRVKDVVPQLVCQAHPNADDEAQIRTEKKLEGEEAKEIIGSEENKTYYPIYYKYERNYGYDNTTHPLSIVTTIKDAYGNPVKNAGGVVTVTMAQVDDGEKNRVLTAREEVDAETGKATYYGTDANPTFPVRDNDYYLGGIFTGSGEYDSAYYRYWKVNDTKRADNSANSLSGLSKLKINTKLLSDESVVITSVTPPSAAYIGAEGADAGNTSRAGTVRVRDTNTNLNLTSGDDLQNYYRRLTTEDRGENNKAGEVEKTQYWYADDMYYTATGAWYGPKMIDTEGKTEEQIKTEQTAWEEDHVKKIDGQAVGTYSVEFAAIKVGDPQSINYDDVSGWKGNIFNITPYTGRLNTTMTSSVVVPDVGNDNVDAVKNAVKKVINGTDGNAGLTIADIYGNDVPKNEVTYTFVPADSNAKVDNDGWPCTEGLYSIEIHPYDSGEPNAVTQELVGTPTDNPNYSDTATGYQALLITKEALTMEIQTKNEGDTDWTNDALEVPYTGEIYRDDTVKAFDNSDSTSKPDNLRVVKKSSADTDEQRLDVTQYSLQVGLPDDPVRDSGRYVLVATDNSGKYVAIGNILVKQNDLASANISPASKVYTGKSIDPTITVKGSLGKTLVEGRDYTVSMVREDPTGNNTATGIILNAGTYEITIAGKGNYTGTKGVTFTVQPKDINLVDDSGIPVNIAVPSYNLGIARPKATLTYNGLVMTAADYTQTFEGDNEANPSKITFTGRGNYTGARTIDVDTVKLPEDAGLIINDANSNYAYQATDLFGYVDYNDLSITEVTKEAADRVEPSFEDYEVTIATVAEYAANKDNPPFVAAEDEILDVGAYIVKMTRIKDNKTGYFFMRVSPRAVTITIEDQSKVYGTAKRAFPYSTNLETLVGHMEKEVSQVGTINKDTHFFAHDDGKIDGDFYRAEGEDVGSYYYSLNTFTAGSNYTLTVSNETMFTIIPKSLSKETGEIADDITVDCADTVEYTGYPVSPLKSVTYKTALKEMGIQTLAESADYTLTYFKKDGNDWTPLSAAPIDVGEYKLRITGKGNYVNAVEQEFSVTAIASTLNVEIADSNVTYKAAAYNPKVMVKTAGDAALYSNNYELTYSYTDMTGKTTQENQPFQSGVTAFTEAGTYTIYANGVGNYNNAHGQANFVIKPKSLAENDEEGDTTAVAVAAIDEQTYTGQDITFNTGLKSVTYSGLKTDGLQTPKSLEYGTDYNLTYMSNNNAGTATAVLIGAGNYTGSRAMTFTINPKPIYVEVDEKTLTKTYGTSDPEYTYKVYANQAGTEELTDVKITGKPGRGAGENAGDYPLKVEGGTLSAGANYTISLLRNPKLTIEKKAIGTNDSPAERIVATIGYVEAKAGAVWPEPQVTYWKEKGSSKLTKDTDYTVTYHKTDGTPVESTAAITEDSVGSYYALVTAKGTNYTEQIKLPFMVVKEGSYLALTATGGGIYTPNDGAATLTAMFGDKTVTVDSAITYTVTCYSASGSTKPIAVEKNASTASFPTSDAGTYVVNATYQTSIDGAPAYAYGSTTVVVTPKDIDDQTVTVADIPTQDYTGGAVTPELKIIDGEKTLTASTDYTVSYTNNVNPNSTATATITGLGNYTGTRTVTFKIGPMQYTLHYNENGGNETGVPKTAHSQDTFSVAAGSMTHANATVDGKDVPVLFIGWSQLNNSGKIYKKGDNLPEMIYAGQTLTPMQPVTTLYAIWGYDTDGNGIADVTQNAIKVVYDKGISTGTGEPPKDTQTYLIGALATAMNNGGLTYTKDNEDYVFMGWTPTALTDTNKEKYAVTNLTNYLALGSIYPTGSTFYVGSTGGSECTLYPVWGVDKDKTNTADFLEGNALLIYDTNGATGGTAPAPQESKAGATVTLSSDRPTRNGAVFLGWTTTRYADLLTTVPTEKYYTAGDSYTLPTGTYTHQMLYALWAADENNNGTPDYEETEYKVTYDPNGGEGKTPTDNRTYLAGQTVTLASGAGLSKTGCTFAGWKLDDTTTYQPGETFTITKNTTLTAVWTKNTYTVKVETIGSGGKAYIGAENITEDTVNYNGTATITLVPETGYHVSSVYVGGTDQTSSVNNNTLELTNITEDKAVVVTFQSNSFAVTTPQNQVYTGTAVVPDLTVTSDGTTLTADTNYTVTYTAVDGTGAKLDSTTNKPLNAGTYNVTVSGKDGTAYAGKTAATTFVVTPKPLAEGMVTNIANQAYTGSAITPEVVVKDSSKTLVKGTDYTVSYSNNVAPGEAAVTITGLGNYSGTVTKTFTITDGRFRVTYTADGATGGTVPTDGNVYLKDATVTVLGADNLTKDGYVFGGWKLNDTEIIYQPGATFEIAGDTRLTAVWTPKDTVTVTYYLPEGKTENSASVYIGGTVTLRDSNDLSKDSYTFLGWTPGENATTIDSAEQTGSLGRLYKANEELVLTTNVNLSPVWIKTDLLSTFHLVLYRPNGGDDSGFEESTAYLVANNTDHQIISDVPTRTGYTFAGWKANGADGVHPAGENITITGDVTFTAQWTAQATYKVTYDAGDATVGTAPTDSNTYLSGKTVTVLEARDLTKDGYVFGGWKLDDTTTYQPGATFTITGNTTLTAVWKVRTYTVTTSAGAGGSITPSKTVNHGDSFTFTVTVDSGYKLDEVLVNDKAVELDGSNSYTITNIQQNCTVIATFTSTSGGGIGGGDVPDPTPKPDDPNPQPHPNNPDDTGISDVLNTKEHKPFMIGYVDGRFGPDDNTTRAQVAQMFYNLLLDKDVPITVHFDDVSDDEWYAKAVHTLASMNVIKGVGGNMYEPEREITRAEFCAIITRFTKQTTAAKTNFVDVTSDHWAYDYINVAASYGWISGYGGNRFGPDDLITRAQAATMTNRMLGRLCDREAIDSGAGRVFPDVTYSHWGWYQIAEATTDHAFTINEDYTSETWKS